MSLFNFFNTLTCFSGGTKRNKKPPPPRTLVITHATISLDEFRFQKDQYVSTDRTRNNPALQSSGNISDPRIYLERLEGESEYKNVLATAEATLARRKFFPQRWDIKALGDARMKLGKSFIVTGERVPFNESNQQTMNLVCTRVTHSISGDGYYMEVQGVRKFVLESGDTDQP